MSLSSPIEGDDLGDMPASQSLAPKKGGLPKLDRKQVEQRIEEDRERHKRARENIWAFQPTEEYTEADKLWDEASSFGEDDHVLGEEEWQEWKEAMRNACSHRREEAEAREAAEREAAARDAARKLNVEANGGKGYSR
jgi:CTD kinase subunit gamma